MSSDYIPRLRSELLRAGAAPQRRWRPALALRPVAVAAAVALLVVAVVIALPLGTDERAAGPGAAGHTYSVEPPAAAEQTAKVIRDRLDAAGVDADVSVAGSTLTISDADGKDIASLVKPGRLTIFDWERHGAPALTNADIERAVVAKDVQTGEPVVVLELTAHGQAAFKALTRELARRGADKAPPGAGVESFQHLAIALDGTVLSKPYINFQVNPDGIDGADGAQISDHLTDQTARELAAVLNGGPLPGTLH
jgi:preprotein translocase subunit SecD